MLLSFGVAGWCQCLKCTDPTHAQPQLPAGVPPLSLGETQSQPQLSSNAAVRFKNFTVRIFSDDGALQAKSDLALRLLSVLDPALVHAE